MKTVFRLLIGFSLALGFGGCATTLPVHYVPSASIRGSGNVSIGTFRYVPADEGKMAPNEFQKACAGIGKVSLSQPVSELIQTSLRKELIVSGFDVDASAPLVIEGDIERFKYDWIGIVEVDFYLDITFRIYSAESCVLTFRASSHQKAPKTMNQDTEAIRAAISQCFSDMLLEARAKRIL
jgi:hypothetical protein